MKKNLASNLFLAVVAGALAYAMITTPPGGVRWGAFVADEASLLKKLSFLTNIYVWPAILSFVAISMFQLQFRIASSGVSGRLVFSVCAVASGAMMLGLRTISLGASSSPSYIFGMALGYTMMSRLYAVRMRKIFNGVRIPWPIWRGDLAAVEEINRAAQLRMMHSRMPSAPARAA